MNRVAWLVWWGIFGSVFLWSAIGPRDRFTWALEVAPAVVGAAVIVATARRFPLTPLALWLALAHCVVLMVGGHYTYAEVPAFDRLAEVFGWSRNNYDKLGHFAQGFVPAVLAREVLVRNEVIRGRGWLGFLAVCFCLAFSAFYELLEWWVALASGESAEAFLGTQGYEWDTQSDMAWALFGAIAALVALGRVHDRAIARMGSTTSGPVA